MMTERGLRLSGSPRYEVEPAIARSEDYNDLLRVCFLGLNGVRRVIWDAFSGAGA